MMSRIASLVCVVVSAAGCATLPPLQATSTRPYDTGDLRLLVRYTAKETCSCTFVMEMDEAFCRAFTRANPPVASSSINRDDKTVSASALLLWSARARFVDDQVGCVIETE
jgi:hypothetical protein